MQQFSVEQRAKRIELVAKILVAYVARNSVAPSDLSPLFRSVAKALGEFDQPRKTIDPIPTSLTKAQIRRSITKEHLISFEDGKPYKTLGRHLARHGLTSEAYREKWGLPSDYPMTAPSLSAQRSRVARSIGLGQMRRKIKDAALVHLTSENAVSGSRPTQPKKCIDLSKALKDGRQFVEVAPELTAIAPKDIQLPKSVVVEAKDCISNP